MEVMRIGTGMRNGRQIWNYQSHTARRLCEMLKEHQDVELRALGKDAAYNLIRIVGRAADYLKQDNLTIFTDEFTRPAITLTNAEGEETSAFGVSIVVHLTALQD